MRTSDTGTPAPGFLRWGIYGLAVLLTFLLIWLLGFILADIGRLEGPDFQAVSRGHVAPALTNRAAALEQQIRDLEVQVSHQREVQQNLQRSMSNARETMQQMMDLHRLSLEQKLNPSDPEREALATSQKRFLDAQERFEQANEAISKSTQAQYDLNQELKSVRRQIEEQHQPARREFDQLLRRHRFKVASLKLAFIVPLFLLAAGAVHRFRASAYRPVTFAALAATFWKLGTVMFEHFPREFFKYIAIVTGLVIVLAFLLWMLRRSVRPGRATQLKRFREAYTAHRCPLCAHPIARGALKYAVWTRRGPRSLAPGAPAAGVEAASSYACPSCGAVLFETCGQCGSARHSLLPFCDTCGHEKAVRELEPQPA